MFPDFKDPLAVTRMEIIGSTKTAASSSPSRCAQVKTSRWSIPSHGDYPADAKEHLAEAATSLMGLKTWIRPGLGEGRPTRPPSASCTTSTA